MPAIEQAPHIAGAAAAATSATFHASAPKSRRGSTLSAQSSVLSHTSSTDDLLSPLRPHSHRQGRRSGIDSTTQCPPPSSSSTTHWDSTPLIFALLPAVAGLVFPKNGSSIVTDLLILGLAAIWLNWSLKVPWDWYHSAQSIRYDQEAGNGDIGSESVTADTNTIAEEDDLTNGVRVKVDAESSTSPTNTAASESHLPPTQAEDDEAPRRKAAMQELHTYEVFALLACFISPVLSAYLLHTLRASLSRPSEGLVSNYNLTIFLLAAEIRPLSHLVRLVRARTLHLQRIVAVQHELATGSSSFSPYPPTSPQGILLDDIPARLAVLESLLSSKSDTAKATTQYADQEVKQQQQNHSLHELRRTLQPDLDALNRAVRRYEKRATLQTFQTDSRLAGLEARLDDAIALAAVAARGGGVGVGDNLFGRGRRGGTTAGLTKGLSLIGLACFQVVIGLLAFPLRVAEIMWRITSHITRDVLHWLLTAPWQFLLSTHPSSATHDLRIAGEKRMGGQGRHNVVRSTGKRTTMTGSGMGMSLMVDRSGGGAGAAGKMGR